MDLPKTWLSKLVLAVSVLLIAGCAAPVVLPPPPTATPASEYLEKPQPILIREPLVPQLADGMMAEEQPTPISGVSLQEAPTPVPSLPSLCVTVVNTQVLNVRSSPAAISQANLVGQVQAGEVFVIIGNNNDRSWYQVEIPAISGDTWLFSSYVDEGPCQ